MVGPKMPSLTFLDHVNITVHTWQVQPNLLHAWASGNQGQGWPWRDFMSGEWEGGKVLCVFKCCVFSEKPPRTHPRSCVPRLPPHVSWMGHGPYSCLYAFITERAILEWYIVLYIWNAHKPREMPSTFLQGKLGILSLRQWGVPIEISSGKVTQWGWVS